MITITAPLQIITTTITAPLQIITTVQGEFPWTPKNTLGKCHCKNSNKTEQQDRAATGQSSNRQARATGQNTRSLHQDTATGPSNRTEHQDTATGHITRTQQQDRAPGHSTRTQPQDRASTRGLVRPCVVSSPDAQQYKSQSLN